VGGVLEADRIERGCGTHNIRVERDDPYGDTRDMEGSFDIIGDTRLRERL